MTVKYYIAILLLLSNYTPASGQGGTTATFFQAKSRTHLYYVNWQSPVAYLYEMGRYLDKAGTGYSIRSTDTLIGQPDGHYTGKTTRLIHENNKYYLVNAEKKPKKLLLEEAGHPAAINYNLNNAYYLDSYFRLSEVLNKRYPLNHHTFRNGFFTWNALPGKEKEMDYEQFRAFAAHRLQGIKDSISSLQDRRVVLTHYLIQQLGTLGYQTLKDSLARLPAEYGYLSKYYSTVMAEVAKQRPEYFFRLAEDFPENRSLIFMSVKDDREVIQGLRTMEGHQAIKQAFFKDRRFGKTMPYKIIGTFVVIIGLIAWLIASQK